MRIEKGREKWYHKYIGQSERAAHLLCNGTLLLDKLSRSESGDADIENRIFPEFLFWTSSQLGTKLRKIGSYFWRTRLVPNLGTSCCFMAQLPLQGDGYSLGFSFSCGKSLAFNQYIPPRTACEEPPTLI